MELSKLKIEKRNKLYFNKYQYKARANIPGACYTYYTSNMDTFIKRIERWKEEAKNYKHVRSSIYDDNLDKVDYTKIENFLEWRNKHNKGTTIRIESNTVSFFSNDISLLRSLSFLDKDLTLYEARVLSTDTLFLKTKTPYNYRTYFKGRRVTAEFVESLNSFVNAYGLSDENNISNAMINYVLKRPYTKYMYMHGSYFIDYKNESFLSILHMHFPGMLSKTYKLDVHP